MTFLVSMKPQTPHLNGLNRAEKVEALAEAARRQRDVVLSWLSLNGYGGRFADVSDATLFGDFTLSGDVDVYLALRRAPGVDNVIDLAYAPVQLIPAEAS
jgi:hypothetical protein